MRQKKKKQSKEKAETTNWLEDYTNKLMSSQRKILACLRNTIYL